MTVNQLLEKLKSMPGDAVVIVRGYEDGVNEADRVTLCNISGFNSTLGSENSTLPYYYGEYEVTERSGKKAVYISSTRDELKGDI